MCAAGGCIASGVLFPSNQIGFMDAIAIPTMAVFCSVFPATSNLKDQANANYEFWKAHLSPKHYQVKSREEYLKGMLDLHNETGGILRDNKLVRDSMRHSQDWDDTSRLPIGAIPSSSHLGQYANKIVSPMKWRSSRSRT
eukprot:scaffold74439_cov33-Prasinocladus_malaysianus.AAC.1